MIKKITQFLVASLLLISLGYSESNGIWHKAEDIRPGIFGDDETKSGFIFELGLQVEQTLKVLGLIDVTGDVTISNQLTVPTISLNTLTSNSGFININKQLNTVGIVNTNNLHSDSISTPSLTSTSGKITNLNTDSITSANAFINIPKQINTIGISNVGNINTDTINTNSITTGTIRSNVGQNVIIQLG